YLGQLASTYSLCLWDGIKGLVGDSTTEGKKWVFSNTDHNWSLSSSNQVWDFPTSSISYDRRQNEAFKKRQQGQQPGRLKRSDVEEGRRGPKQAWADQHIPSIAGDQNLSTSEQKQATLTGKPDSSGMTGVFNGSTPLQITVNPDKRFKSLPPAEILPRNTTLGGYIFVCNNDTMQEDLKRQLFGLPQRYRDSVRTIQPGLPLFLYNYTTHQLHGIYEAASFGGSNIDPTAWEDKKCRGESRFPAQVRIRIRKQCKPLEEDSFRPILHHYDGPKFRLQLSIPEAVELLDLFMENELP
ncbi:hypothetical protein M758_4G002600, partial [Ceratodon purpureus]